jgi:hypothetical protein
MGLISGPVATVAVAVIGKVLDVAAWMHADGIEQKVQLMKAAEALRAPVPRPLPDPPEVKP